MSTDQDLRFFGVDSDFEDRKPFCNGNLQNVYTVILIAFQKKSYLCFSEKILSPGHLLYRVTDQDLRFFGVDSDFEDRKPFCNGNPVSYTHLTLPTIYSV